MAELELPAGVRSLSTAKYAVATAVQYDGWLSKQGGNFAKLLTRQPGYYLKPGRPAKSSCLLLPAAPYNDREFLVERAKQKLA